MATKGWLLCIEWKDGTTSWECLSNLKESFPVEVLEYAIAAGIDDEPLFKWWMQYGLNNSYCIIAKVNSQYHRRSHKFGLEVPKTVVNILRIDSRGNGDN